MERVTNEFSNQQCTGKLSTAEWKVPWLGRKVRTPAIVCFCWSTSSATLFTRISSSRSLVWRGWKARRPCCNFLFLFKEMPRIIPSFRKKACSCYLTLPTLIFKYKLTAATLELFGLLLTVVYLFVSSWTNPALLYSDCTPPLWPRLPVCCAQIMMVLAQQQSYECKRGMSSTAPV